MIEVPQDCDPVFGEVDKLLRLLTRSKLLHILLLLHQKPGRLMRFSELKRQIDTSSTTLSRRLNELVENGLIERDEEGAQRRISSYSLSSKGTALAPSIQSMYDWIVVSETAIV